jgi:murein peptide amidase A
MLKSKKNSGICFLFVCLLLLLSWSSPVFAYDSSSDEFKEYLNALDDRFSRFGWKDIHPGEISWEYYRTTKQKNPLMFVIFGNNPKRCTLFLGGVHGDELPTVYLMFKLAHYVKENPSLFKDTCIVIAPLVNPDGFLAASPTRVNANGIDVNRNFVTGDWYANAISKWTAKGRVKRYYPGARPGSEQETQFQMALIKRFKPQKILSAHSPLNMFDYDGPSSDLNSFEKWIEKISREANYPSKRFGYYPGSLGNYAGRERNIFTLTLELPTSDPKKSSEYFLKFHPSILKFINLPVVGSRKNIKVVDIIDFDKYTDPEQKKESFDKLHPSIQKLIHTLIAGLSIPDKDNASNTR